MKLVYDHYQPSEDSENKELEPIIFLHGRNDTRKTWRKFAQDVVEKTGRQAYAFDLRNHGDSPWSVEMNIAVLVEDLEEFMNDHGIKRAILIGHSLGGKTILAFALKKPEAVEGLIIEDTGIKNYNPTTQEALRDSLISLKESIKCIPPGASEAEAKKAVVTYLDDNLIPAQPRGTRRGIYDFDTVPIKKEGEKYVWKFNMDVIEDMMMSGRANYVFSGVYTGKVLFIYGTKSFVRVKEDGQLYNFFPQATKVPVENTGHLIHQVCPEKFSKLVTDFILQHNERYF